LRLSELHFDILELFSKLNIISDHSVHGLSQLEQLGIQPATFDKRIDRYACKHSYGYSDR
jgi:hypothetical protein